MVYPSEIIEKAIMKHIGQDKFSQTNNITIEIIDRLTEMGYEIWTKDGNRMI
jgi:hypothetical protein